MGLRPSPGVVGVLVALVAAYAALHFSDRRFALAHLALIPRRALGPEPWQLFTSAFVHVGFGALLSSCVAIWFFGTPVEQRAGRGYLFKVLVGGTLLGGLASAALGRVIAPNAIVTGAVGASMASIAAFAAVYGSTPIMFFGVQQMKASTTSYIFLAISGVMFLWDGDWLGFAAAAAGTAWGMWGGVVGFGRARTAYDRFRLWRLRRRYKVISGGRDTKRYLN